MVILAGVLSLAWIIARFGLLFWLGIGRFVFGSWTLKRWSAALKTAGFMVETKNRVLNYSIVARPVEQTAERYTIRVERGFRLGWPPMVNRVVVESASLPRTLRIEQPTSAAADLIQGLGGVGSMQTGDAHFDREVRVSGDEEEARAHLDEPGRRALEKLVKDDKGFLIDGGLGVERAGSITMPDKLVARIQGLLDLAEGLQIGDSRLQALAANAVTDTNAEVRYRNLKLLLSTYPSAPQTIHVARQSLGSPDERCVLLAASALGTEGASALLKLVADTQIDSDLRVEALRRLSSGHAEDHLVAGLQAGLRAEPEVVIREALRLSEQVHQDRLVPDLIPLLDHEPPVARLAVAVLTTYRAPEVEDALIARLKRRGSGIHLAAMAALGQMGSVLSLEHLEPLTTGLFTSSEVKGAAQTAMAQIQARIGPGEAGRVSLAATGPEGGLSLAHQFGGMSLSPQPVLEQQAEAGLEQEAEPLLVPAEE